jgi:acyl-CoA thioesterase-2
VGDLTSDTALEGGDGSYRAVLSDDWEIWGPMGGYVAAVALRAAGRASGRPRPASINGHFLGGVGLGPVEVATEVNRVTRSATSVRVTVTQGERTGFVALVWGVDDLDGLEHHVDRRPQPAPDPETVPTFQQRLSDDGEPQPPHRFWQNLEYRPLDWVPRDEKAGGRAPTRDAWYRLVPTATFEDPWVDACRLTLFVDLDGWPAAVRPAGWEAAWFAPTIELTARFHHLGATDPWVRATAESAVAADGVVGATSEVWDRSGRLLASGGSTLLCRPVAERPDR